MGTTGAAMGLALAPKASAAQAQDAPPQSGPKGPGMLKFSSQLGVIPGKELPAKLATMERWGFEAVELPGDVVGKEKYYQDALKNTHLKVSAICFGSLGGALVSELPERRQEAVETLKRVLTAAGELKSTGVIYVPAFNGQTKLGNQEIRAILLDRLPEIGEHAVKVGSRLLLEPLNRAEAFFLRQLADAAAICRDVNSPGIAMMGDFYHMYTEEPSNLGAFISAGAFLHHVHMASAKTRVLPGQSTAMIEVKAHGQVRHVSEAELDAERYRDGFRGLKMIGYKDYCSFECGCRGQREVEIPKSMAFLRNQWEQA